MLLIEAITRMTMRQAIRRAAITVLPGRTFRQLVRSRDALFRTREHYERQERGEFLRRAWCMLAFNGINGDYAEFGCASATTFGLSYAAMNFARSPRHLWAFDSFQGLPSPNGDRDDHPEWTLGNMAFSLRAFDKACKEQGITRVSYTTVPGYYDDTIAPGATGYTGPLPSDIALAYVDCDLYSSTVTVLEFLRCRLKHGMVIALDDYFCYSNKAVAGERAALMEFESTDNRFSFSPYQAFGCAGMSFIVEDRRLLTQRTHCDETDAALGEPHSKILTEVS